MTKEMKASLEEMRRLTKTNNGATLDKINDDLSKLNSDIQKLNKPVRTIVGRTGWRSAIEKSNG